MSGRGKIWSVAGAALACATFVSSASAATIALRSAPFLLGDLFPNVNVHNIGSTDLHVTVLIVDRDGNLEAICMDELVAAGTTGRCGKFALPSNPNDPYHVEIVADDGVAKGAKTLAAGKTIRATLELWDAGSPVILSTDFRE